MDPSETNLRTDQDLLKETTNLDETGLQTPTLQDLPRLGADRLGAVETRSPYANTI